MNEIYRNVLIAMIIIAVSVSFKRYVMSLYLGKRLYCKYLVLWLGTLWCNVMPLFLEWSRLMHFVFVLVYLLFGTV